MRLEGFAQLQRALTRAPELVKKHAASEVAHTSLRIANRAAQMAPVDTGTLRRDITWTTTGDGLSGGAGLHSNAAFYWRFIEYGTVKMPARPFFRPAAEMERDNFVRGMRDIGPHIERELSV
jgi:HK97 gp10 family phage protein